LLPEKPHVHQFAPDAAVITAYGFSRLFHGTVRDHARNWDAIMRLLKRKGESERKWLARAC
jgi:hypothetical protein